MKGKNVIELNMVSMAEILEGYLNDSLPEVVKVTAIHPITDGGADVFRITFTAEEPK